MPTPKRGARIGGSARNQRHILSNLAAALFEHDSIKTTDAKAKLLRPYAEKLITKARSGTLADRREVLAQVPQKDAVARLFNDPAPQFAKRDGGHTRLLENRTGDNAPMTQISLVLEETVTASAERTTKAAAANADTDSADPSDESTMDSEGAGTVDAGEDSDEK